MQRLSPHCVIAKKQEQKQNKTKKPAKQSNKQFKPKYGITLPQDIRRWH